MALKLVAIIVLDGQVVRNYFFLRRRITARRNGIYSRFQVCEIHSSCRDTAVPCPYGILNVRPKPGICCNLVRKLLMRAGLTNKTRAQISQPPSWLGHFDGVYAEALGNAENIAAFVPQPNLHSQSFV